VVDEQHYEAAEAAWSSFFLSPLEYSAKLVTPHFLICFFPPLESMRLDLGNIMEINDDLVQGVDGDDQDDHHAMVATMLT
jgi:hypothetical protein